MPTRAADAVRFVRGHAGAARQGDQRHHRRGGGQDRVRELLDGQSPPAGVPPPQRIEIQQEQDRGQGHGGRLRQECRREGGQGQRPPDRPQIGSPLEALEVRQDGEQEEQPAEHVAPLGDPRHRFDAQRVDAPHQSRERPGHHDGAGRVATLGAAALRRGEKAAGDQIHERRVGGVQDQIAQRGSPRGSFRRARSSARSSATSPGCSGP